MVTWIETTVVFSGNEFSNHGLKKFLSHGWSSWHTLFLFFIFSCGFYFFFYLKPWLVILSIPVFYDKTIRYDIMIVVCNLRNFQITSCQTASRRSHPREPDFWRLWRGLFIRAPYLRNSTGTRAPSCV